MRSRKNQSNISRPVRRSAAFELATVIAVLLSNRPVPNLGPLAMAQQAPPPADAAEAQAIENRFNVYLNDSFEAADAIVRIGPWVRAGRWSDAAELLQQTADRQPGKLIRVGEGHYVGLRRHVNDLIAAWPKPGIEAYRTLFEREVETLPRTGGDSIQQARWIETFERYFCTAGAAKLADLIGQAAVEAGDLNLAEQVYRRVLERHPDAKEYARSYGSVLAVLWAMNARASFDGSKIILRSSLPPAPTTTDVGENSDPAKNSARAETIVASLDTTAKMRWMGQDRSLGEVLTEVQGNFSAISAPLSAEDWPTFGGNAGRNRPAQSHVDELGIQWRAAYNDRPVDTPDIANDNSESPPEPDPARELVVHPVASGGLIFVQRHREIIALHRTTGEVSWRFRADPMTSEPAGYVQEQPTGWDGVTVAGGRVYASLSGQVTPYYSYGSARTPHELICLDAVTGHVIWRVNESSFETRFTELHFDSAPLVDGNHLFVAARRRRSFGFEDCYLMRFHAATGQFQSQVHLGGASTGSFGAQLATKSIAAAEGGIIYVCSNLGTVAAVESHTGEVRWLRLYPRQPLGPEGVASSWGGEINPWQFNPVFVSASGIVARPLDANHLFVFARDDGRILHTVAVEELSSLQTVLGINDDTLFGIGREAIGFDLNAGSIRWRTALPDASQLLGRGIWAGDRALVPTTKFLCAFDTTTGRRTDIPWGPEGESGNLLALPDQLIVAGTRYLTSYVRKADIWKALQDRLLAAPSDPTPALELAEVAMRSGEVDEALNAFDEAVRRSDLDNRAIDTTLQDRLFKDALSFARALSERGELNSKRLDQLFNHASRFPTDAASHLGLRLRFAALFERDNRPDRSVRLYQQVLQDRSLRDMPIDSRAAGSPKAAVFAAERVAALIEQHGATIYAPFESEAERLLESAQAARDRAGLERVVASYPNSRAAPGALIALGEQLSTEGKGEEAVRQFIQALHRYPQRVDRAHLLKRIADSYEASGHREEAYRWLTKASLEYPAERIDHDGKPLTFSEYRNRLADVRDRVEPRPPDVSPPLARTFERRFDGTVALLAPLLSADPSAQWSAVYVNTAEGLRALDPRRGTDLWKEPVAVQQRPELLTARADRALFASAFEIFALDPRTGDKLWSYGEVPRHLQDEGADWEQGNTFRTHALFGDRLVSVRDQGNWSCLDVTSGRLLWSQSHQPPPLGRIALNERWVLYHVVQGGRNALCLLNAADGEWIDGINTNEDRPVEALFITLDGQLILVTSQTVLSFDPATGTRRWSLQVDGHIRRASLVLDVDAMYLSPEGRDVWKVSLDDGRLLWEAPGLLGRGEDDITLDRTGAQLIVSSDTSIVSVDSVTGMTLWRGITPPKAKLRTRIMTQSFALTIDTVEPAAGDYVAFFYDLRNASGVIPAGGAPKLGALEDIRRVMAADAAILIQTGPSRLQGLTNE